MPPKSRLLVFVALASVIGLSWILSLSHSVKAQPATLTSPLSTPTATPILVNWTSPAHWAENVARRSVLTIHFSREVDRAEIEHGLSITPPLSGTISWQPQTLMFVPTEGWEPGRTYRVALHRADQTLVKYLSFTIRSLVREPAGFRQSIEWNEPIELAFNEPIDRVSAEAAFSITPAVRGSFTWQSNTLVFKPREDLPANATYTVRLAPTVKLSTGEQPLRTALIWHFYTPDEQGQLTFGDGPQAQVVDPGGARRVQYAVQGGLIRPITARLYTISSDDLVTRFSALVQPVYLYGDTPSITTTGLSLVREWRVPVAARWQTSDLVLPDDLPIGLYLLTLDQPAAKRVGLIVAYTPDTLIVKQGGDHLTVWAKHIDGGAIAEMRLRVLTAANTLVAEGVTDAQGIWNTALPIGQTPFVIIGEHDGAFTFSGFGLDWSPQRRAWWQSPAPTVTKPLLTRAVIYTDRPIYRPGQTVNVDVFARYDNDAVYTRIPLEWDVNVRLRDARDNLIEAHTLHVDEFGALHTSFDLAEGGTLGEYTIEVQVKDDVVQQHFQVESYTKPDFAVSVHPDRSRLVNGQPVSITIEARTPFGAPVANAAVTLRPYAREIQWRGYDETEPLRVWVPLDGMQISGRTNERGQWLASFTPRLDNNRYASQPSASMLLEATVIDDSGEAISASTPLGVYNAPTYMKFTWLPRVYPSGAPITVEATVFDVNDQLRSDQVITATLYARSRDGSYRIEIGHVVSRTDVTGHASFSLTSPVATGAHRLELRTADAQAIDETVWVHAADWPTYTEDAQTLSISADKSQYVSGDTALLAIRAPMSGPALLTIERGRVRRAQIVDLTAPLTIVPLRLQDDDAPNIHVVVNAYQPITTTGTDDRWLSTTDAKLLIASVDVNVSAEAHRLNVSLTSDRTIYAPRSQATVSIQTTDAAGQPVRSAVALTVVDDTIFALSDLAAPDLFAAFYGPRANSVQTYDSLRPQRYLPCECGGGGGGGEYLSGNPRFNFPDTAYWQPTIFTDESGHASITVTLPDSLTRWRIVARAITAAEAPLVGEAQILITTTQAIVIRPILPHTFVQGDRVLLSASVYNNTAMTHTTQVHIEANNLRLLSAPQQTITLEAQSSTTLGWWAEVVDTNAVTITLHAKADQVDRADRVADAVRVVIPVLPLAVPHIESSVGDVADQIVLPITLTQNVIVAGSSLQIDLAPSIAATMLDGLAYLTGYPYGCVEQTMSKALPNAVVGRALTTLNVSQPQLTSNLTKPINAGLQRLYGYQHEDGGWGWWYDDATDDYQTAYVLFGLAMTKQANYTVDNAVIDRGAAYLHKRLPAIDDVRTKVYGLYALAISGHGELTTTQAITNSAQLDAFSRAALALTLHTLGDEDGAQFWLQALKAAVTVEDGTAHWSTNVDDDGAYHQKTLASATRSTALALEALVQLSPDDPLIPPVVRWLMARRTINGWGTTQETAYTVIALTDYLRAARELDADSTYRVYVNDALIQTGTLRARDLQTTIQVPGTQLYGGLNRVRVEREGTAQRLYYRITSKLLIGGTSADQAVGPITVTRAYLNLKTHKPITTTQPGDLIEVQVTVKVPTESWYMAIEDPLPGGLEAVNERLNTTGYLARRDVYTEHNEEFRYERYGYNQKEIRDDRVVFFITHLARGTHQITYLARVLRGGVFNVLPAQAYLMYAPEQWGRSRGETLTVTGTLALPQAQRISAPVQMVVWDRP
ncbi:MAG: MG2 domain-containing protein [Anaerolineae bacterium]